MKPGRLTTSNQLKILALIIVALSYDAIAKTAKLETTIVPEIAVASHHVILSSVLFF